MLYIFILDTISGLIGYFIDKYEKGDIKWLC